MQVNITVRWISKIDLRNLWTKAEITARIILV